MVSMEQFLILEVSWFRHASFLVVGDGAVPVASMPAASGATGSSTFEGVSQHPHSSLGKSPETAFSRAL